MLYLITSAPIGGAKYYNRRVCLSVCSLAYLKKPCSNFIKFSEMLPVDVARLSFDDNAMSYIIFCL